MTRIDDHMIVQRPGNNMLVILDESSGAEITMNVATARRLQAAIAYLVDGVLPASWPNLSQASAGSAESPEMLPTARGGEPEPHGQEPAQQSAPGGTTCEATTQCQSPAVVRVRLTSPRTAKVMSEFAACEAHRANEQRLAAFGMVDVDFLPLNPLL
jgi:hypothetical protein